MKSRDIIFICFCMSMVTLSCKTIAPRPEEVHKATMVLKSPAELSLEDVQKIQYFEDSREIISTLAADDFKGRMPLTDGYRKAAEYVSEVLSEANIDYYSGSSYNDTFLLKGEETYNVVGLIKSGSSSNEYVMICAHLDHIGTKPGLDSIYNGANDNASGVTAVLQAAKVLSRYAYQPNIIVALFSAEESGLVGSKHLASRLKKEGVKLTHVFNFEMIGKTLSSGANEVYITGFDKSNLADEMNKKVDREFVKFLPAEVGYQLFSRSDNFPFYAEFKIPSHTISTFDFKNYDHYHKATDEVELLDLANMHEIINSSTLAISKILESNEVSLKD